MNPTIAVLPHARVSSNSEKFPLIEAKKAFSTSYQTDSHILLYSYPDDSPTPRLRLGNLADLIERDFEPVLNWVFVDVDNENHEKWTPDEAEAHWFRLKKAFKDPVFESANFYGTRGGYRLVFKLEAPIKVSFASHYIEQFSNYLRNLGIPLDAFCIQKWNTIFRLPRVTREGEILKAFVDLEGLAAPLNWIAPLPLVSSISPSNTAHPTPERPHMKPLGDFGWGTLEACAEVLKGQLDTLKEGRPIAAKGARQATMFKLAATIVGKLKLDSPTLVYQALAPSVVATGGVSLDDLWDRCCYLVEIDKAKRKAREEVKEQVGSNQPPIVYHGTSYYIYDTNGKSYRPPVSSPAVCQALEQWCNLSGLETRTKQGKPRGISEYLADYSRQAVEVIVEMGREKGVFHPNINGGTLLDGCCTLTKVLPEESIYIEQWLKLLSGEYYETLLDWIATVGRLERPTCALYLQGPPGTGKGLFANGVAALWGSGATSYSDATGKFNGALTRNPIVLIDEMSQAFDGGEGFSGTFRTLIGESSRQLRRKNLPSSTLRGCPRLVITANNADALVIRENLGKDDLMAIAERILHIKHSETAKNYLKCMGGREFTSNWVLEKNGSPGAIPKHIKYLAENRKVSSGTRFLVSGIISDWHRDLMGNSGIQGAILAALAHFIDRDRKVEGIIVEKGSVYVNVPSLRGQWGLLMGDHPPREGALATALKTLAGNRQVRKSFPSGRLRCYKLELEDVIRRAEALQIGDIEKFESLLIDKGLENGKEPRRTEI